MSGVTNKLMSASGGGEPEGAWDLSYAYYNPPEGLAWNLSTAVFRQNSSISAQEATPSGLFFRGDGLKMYVVGKTSKQVHEYNLSTAWDVVIKSFVQSFSVSSQEDQPEGLFFKPDGLKMYIVGSNGDEVNEYDLSTAWNISTASFLQNFSVSAQEVVPLSIYIRPDGLKMYITGQGSLSVNEYNLSTAWDVSTASFLQNFSVSAQESEPTGLFFRPDGLKMYVSGTTGDDVNEYDLSTAWDVSTATFLRLFSVAAQETNPQSVFFKPDGGAMYVLGATGDDVNQYTLGGFRDITNAGDPRGLFFREDGEKLYIASKDTEDVVEYDISTPWDVSSASYVRSFPLALQEGNPVGIFFKPDGTQMFICGFSGEDVNEYSLSTAWNVSTASFVRVFSVSAQDTTPGGLSFKPDGTKMYVLGNAGDDVNEYNLSTAWNISTASFVQNFSVAAQEGFPRGLFFRTDGLKMYVVGFSLDRVNEYDLSTAWDISAASFVQSFSVAAQETVPSGLFFKDDGTQMFVSGEATDAIYSYTLGVQP